ncbi:MAG: sensor histidine kinase, partial [Lachnospiraceae bacterium]
LSEYLDSLKETLDDIDVISVVGRDNVRLYHSNHALIGTVYDGNLPKFDDKSRRYYTTDETGPSGMQRRAYAAIYDENGQYMGVVMAIMLMENIHSETYQTLLIFALITIAALVIELFISVGFFEKIKMSLLGFEPDTFTAMYKIRDNILESLAEGILAIGGDRTVQFANEAAVKMLETAEAFTGDNIVGQKINDISNGEIFVHALESGEKEYNRNLGNTDILVDSIPIKEEDKIVGAVGILHNRAEYTKLMEDLTGTRYLVDSMRANNHDFTNKLHVILGLIQMGMYEEATSYIQNITMVQREIISKIMNAVNDPAVAALLIGKTARAAELDVKFILREGCCYSPLDMNLPSEILVTVIGNLLDNSFDAMNEKKDYDDPKELLFGIYSRPGAVLITVDDTGNGIKEQDMAHIFEKGYSSKGEGRGMGLYQVKTMVEEHGGKITVESQEGIGTSFSVSFMGKRI